MLLWNNCNRDGIELKRFYRSNLWMEDMLLVFYL